MLFFDHIVLVLRGIIIDVSRLTLGLGQEVLVSHQNFSFKQKVRS